MPPQRRGLFRLLDESSSEEEDSLSRSFLGAEPTLKPPIETTSFLAFDQEHQWRTATPQNEPIERPTPETTETRTSYNTAPELSEPVEHLFDALLNQERTLKREDRYQQSKQKWQPTPVWEGLQETHSHKPYP